MPEAAYRVRRSLGPVPTELLAVDHLLVSLRSRVVKDDGRTTVATLSIGGAEIVLKRFRDDTLARAMEVLALGSGAARVWRGAALLQAAGLPAPEVVAVLERPCLGIPTRSCAVARLVPGQPLDELWRTRRGRARRTLTRAFAAYLRHLHAAGLYPQDLRGANVIVRSESPPVFVLVDLDRVRRYRRLSWRRRRKNIVQVHRSVGRGASRSERMRFLRCYLGRSGRAEIRRVVTEILRASQLKDAEYLRRRGETPQGTSEID